MGSVAKVIEDASQSAVKDVAPPGQQPWHEALDRAPELEIWVHATTWPELVAQAGCAVGEQLLRDAPAVASRRWRELAAHAVDRTSLLAAWLNELMLHAELEWWVPMEFAAVRATDTTITVRARGVRIAEPPAALKAATPERVQVRDVPGGLEAKIVLDV